MPHGDLAQLSAVIGGLGAAAMLLSRTRAQLLAGLAVTAIGEATLAAALVPGADLKLLVTPASHAAALVVGLVARASVSYAARRHREASAGAPDGARSGVRRPRRTLAALDPRRTPGHDR